MEYKIVVNGWLVEQGVEITPITSLPTNLTTERIRVEEIFAEMGVAFTEEVRQFRGTQDTWQA